MSPRRAATPTAKEVGPLAATPFAAADRVVVLEPATGDRWLLIAGTGVLKEKGLGVVDTDKLVGQAPGEAVTYGAKDVRLLRPALPDLVATLRRKAQIITPKDASRIVYELGVGAGDRVLESGIGSGAATMALAWAVGPPDGGGRVVVQELRQDFADWAMDNLARAGLADRVDVHIGDLTQGAAAGVADGAPFAAVLLDQPEPWSALPHVTALLAPGARVACYTPQVSQMEKAHAAMRSAGFADMRAMELMERTWEIKEFGSRPSFDGLGHTAFLVFGRHVG